VREELAACYCIVIGDRIRGVRADDWADAVGGAVVLLLRRPPALRSRASFCAYLRRSAYHVFLDSLRRAQILAISHLGRHSAAVADREPCVADSPTRALMDLASSAPLSLGERRFLSEVTEGGHATWSAMSCATGRTRRALHRSFSSVVKKLGRLHAASADLVVR
jgi:hypothetical protein